MRALRSRSSLSAICALVCQLLVLGTPLAQAVVAAAQEEHVELVCTCGTHDAGAMCPMHHSPAKQKPGSSDAQCRMTQADTSIGGLALATGFLPELPQQLAMPIEVSTRLVLAADRPLARPTALDPPPPRS